MAMQGSIDFTIQAKDLTSKPTLDIVAALEKLNLAQQKVSDSSAEASKFSENFEEAQKSLLIVMAELDKRLADSSKFERNKEQQAQLQKAIEGTKEQYRELTARLIEANEQGNKPIAEGARQDLKNLSTEIVALEGQYRALNRAQDSLLAKNASKGLNLNDTLGTSASLTAARAQAASTFDANAAENAAMAGYRAEVAAQATAEAAKRAQLEETANFQKQLDAAADRNARNSYERMYLGLLEDQDRLLATQAAEQQKLTAAATQRAAEEKAAADQLQRYQEIGNRALSNLQAGKQARATTTSATVAPTSSAASAVRSALDPLAEQTRTLAGLETALGEVQKKIEDVGTSSATTGAKVKALKEIQGELATVSKGLATQAGLIDALNHQNSVTDQAKQKLAAAEAEVVRLATAIKNATVVDDQLVQSLTLAQQRVQGAAQAVNTQTTSLDRMKASAQAAGVDTNKLTNEEQRLSEAARLAGQSQLAVSDAMKKAGDGATGLERALALLSGGGGRTTLSFFQRVRGEILSLTATFIGIQGVIGGFGKVLEAVQIDQSLRAQVAQITTSSKEAADEMIFLRAEAERTAYSMGLVGKSYTMVARQMQEYGLNQKTTNKLLSDTLTTARSLNLSEEQIGQVFLALGQIFDKSTVQAQELKTQLGNAGLAGVFPTLAKVMKDQGINTVGDLKKAMQEGLIPAASMVRLFEQLGKSGKKAFDLNLETYSAQIGRFKTQLYDVELQFASSGFLKGVTDGLTDLSNLLKEPETQAALKQLGQSLGSLISALAEFATNTDRVQAAITLLEYFIASKLLLSLASGSLNLAKFAASLTATAGAATALSTALGTAATIGLWGAIIGTGIALGTLLDKIPAVHDQMEKLTDARYKDLFKTIFDFDDLSFNGTLNKIKALETAVAKFSTTIPRSLGTLFGYLQTQIDGTADALEAARKKSDQMGKDAIAKQREMRQEQERQAAVGKDFKDVQGGIVTPPTAAEIQDSADVAVKMTENATEKANEAAQKLNEKADEKELRTQRDFLALYTKQQESTYKALAEARDALNKQPMTPEILAALKDNAEKKVALDKAVQARADADFQKVALQEGQKHQSAVETFEGQRLSAHERTLQQLLAADTEYNRLTEIADSDSLQKRLDTVKSEIDQERQLLQKSIDKNKELISKGQSLGQDVSVLQSDNSALAAKQQRLDLEEKIAISLATQKFELDQQDKAEDRIQTKLQLRAALLANIKESQKAGTISPEDARRQTNDVNARTLDGPEGIDQSIDKLIASKQAFIETQIEAGTATEGMTTKLELEIAQLQNLKAVTDATRPSISDLQKEIANVVSGDVSKGVGDIAVQIANAGKGMESWGDAAKATGDIILNTIADILTSLAEYIIKQTILNSLQKSQSSGGSGGGGGGIWGSIFSAAMDYITKSHTGGIVGSGNNASSPVSPAVFLGAPRMHSGGIPGLKSDEYATILQKNEEVLAANNPRNILNGGGKSNSTQVGGPGAGTDVHFHADAASFFNAGLNSRQGRNQMFAYFSANKSALSKILGS
jgi:tape measure domain-containing protein